jgi:hypothetical protein
VKHVFRVLDVPILISGPNEVVGPIVSAYRRFEVQPSAEADAHQICIGSDGKTLQDDEQTVPLIRGADATLQLYERFLNRIFDETSDCAILHAGAVGDLSGGVLLLAGPSGHGKTSLTLELIARGHRFFSDDYAPIDLATREIRPYPRTVGLLPNGAVNTPKPFREAACDPAVPRLLGKSLVDVGTVLGDDVMATDSVPLRTIVVLESEPASRTVRRSSLVFGVRSEGVAETTARLAKIPGVTVQERATRDDLTTWQLELRHADLPTERVSALLNEDFVVFSRQLPDSVPDFSVEPRLSPLTRRETATVLCREVQNRRPRGRLLRKYDGDMTALFLEVAATLSGASCWSLRVGQFRPTVSLIEGLLAEA